MSLVAVVLPWLLLFQAVDDSAIQDICKEEKAKDVAAAEARVEDCENLLKKSLKAKDAAAARKMRETLKSARESLAKTKSKKLDEYFTKAMEVMNKRADEAERQEKRERKAAADQAAMARRAEERARLMEELRKVGPIVIANAGISTNVIGLPELNFTAINTTDTMIEAFDIEADCFNAFDEPVKSLVGSNVFSGAVTGVIPPGEERVLSVQLSLHANTAKALVRVTRVKPRDGEVCKQSREQAEKTPGAIVPARRP